MGNTVYVVTAGRYSDYHIEGIFTDIHKAELYCAIHLNEFECIQVEEYETDKVQIEGKVYKAIEFRTYKGKYIEGWKFEPEIYNLEMAYYIKPIEEGIKIVNINKPHFVKDEYRFTIPVNKTYTYEQMKKIAQDRWYKYISEQESL